MKAERRTPDQRDLVRGRCECEALVAHPGDNEGINRVFLPGVRDLRRGDWLERPMRALVLGERNLLGGLGAGS